MTPSQFDTRGDNSTPVKISPVMTPSQFDTGQNFPCDGTLTIRQGSKFDPCDDTPSQFDPCDDTLTIRQNFPCDDTLHNLTRVKIRPL